MPRTSRHDHDAASRPLGLTRRQIDTLADRLDLAAKAISLTPAQFERLQRLVHPEQYAVAAAPRPTRAPPGSSAKVAALARRQRRGQPLFAAEDLRPEHDARPLSRFVLVVPLAVETETEARSLAFRVLGIPTRGGKGARGRELPAGCAVERT